MSYDDFEINLSSDADQEFIVIVQGQSVFNIRDEFFDDPLNVELYEPLETRDGKDRYFAGDALVKMVDRAFEVWIYIVAMSGYRERGGIPGDCYPPHRADAYTYEKSFDFFDSDKAAFFPVVNLARRIHESGWKVEEVRIE